MTAFARSWLQAGAQRTLTTPEEKDLGRRYSIHKPTKGKIARKRRGEQHGRPGSCCRGHLVNGKEYRDAYAGHITDGPPTEQFALTHVGTCTDFMESIMHEKDDQTVVTTIDARGALLGRPVLVVLIVSTLTVIGIFSLLYYGTYG
jgi:hypothetical protein